MATTDTSGSTGSGSGSDAGSSGGAQSDGASTTRRKLSDTQEPRFIVGWHTDDEPVIPEMLDEWELNEIDRQRYR